MHDRNPDRPGLVQRLTRLIGLAVFAGALLAVAPPTYAVITLGPDGDEILNADQARDANLLGPEYKDERHGFRISLIAGCRIVEHGTSGATLERLSFIHDDKKWGGTIESAYFKPANYSVEEFLKNAAVDLTKSFSAVQILESGATTVSKKAAGKLVASMETVPDGQRPGEAKLALLKQQMAVQVGTNEYLVLTLYGPLGSKSDLIRSFDAMVASFDVFDANQVQDRRVAAIKNGKQWLSDRSAEELRHRLIEEPQLFRVKIQGQDVGYVRFDEKEDTYLGFKGVSVLTNSRTFLSNGSITMTQSRAFWAYPRQDSKGDEVVQYSYWENSVKNVGFIANQSKSTWATEHGDLQFERQPAAPGADPKGQGDFIMTVTRDANGLLSDTPRNHPVQFEIVPAMPPALPKTLEYLWPRLVDLSKPQQMAFTVFNSGSSAGKLGLRTLSVLGPDSVNIEGKTIEATKLQDELDPGSTTVWVDHNGKILMMRTSDNSLLTPTTEARMSQLWGGRLARLVTSN